ncbi:MAG: hypothetical protein ABGX47_23740 [Martelella sp.]|uniref:hypothetical protein n=1 Tax=Martelella sp. TaxID=1969699 RepID=UPI003242697B
MATTKLNVRVTVGKKTYEPGDDVPINKSFTEEEVERIEAVFGKWRPDEGTGVDKRIAALTAERDQLEEDLATLADEVKALKGGNGSGDDAANQLADVTAERDTLSAEVEKLKASADEAAKKSADEFEKLKSERDQLAADNSVLAQELKKIEAASEGQSKAGKTDKGTGDK